MKNLLLAVAFCCFCVTLNAQIVVTASNYGAFFNSSNTQITDTIPTISPGSAGANVAWNFSSLNSHLSKSNTFMPPASGLLGGSFPMADVCMKQDTNYYYYDSSSTQLNYWGFAGNLLNIGTNDAIVYSNSETVLTFPSTYNTSFNDVSSYDSYFGYNAMYQGYFVDSIRQKSNIATISVIDAWGTITTPNATLPCLRQNIIKNTIDTTWAKVVVGGFSSWIELYNDNATTQSYSYISNIGGGLIATIEYFADSNAIAEVRWNPVTLPVVTLAAQTNVLCNGASTGTASVTASGGISPYTYLWSSGQTSSAVTGLAAGTYTVTVKDAANSSPTLSVTITQPSALIATITSQTKVTCPGCSDGTASVIASGGMAPYSYSWNNGQSGMNASGLAIGSYTVTISDDNACTAIASVSIDTLMIINATDYYSFFSPGNTMIIDTMPTVTPGNAGANVTWYLFSLNSHLTKTNSFISPGAGLLGSSFTNSNVCMKEDTNYYYYDSTNTNLDYWGYAGNVLGIGTNDAIVYGNPETILTFPSTYNTNFTDASSYDRYFAYNAFYQGYWVDSIRQKMITSTISKIDGWGQIVTPNATLPCLRQNILKNIVDTTWAKISLGGNQYWIELYTSADNVQSYSYISNSGGGLIASIEYMPNSNIISQATWNPVSLPIVTLSSQTNVSCNGGNNGSATASVSGGTSPYSYLWSNGQTSATVTGLVSGKHFITVTDAISSTATATVTISEPTALSAAITNQVNATCQACTDGSGTVAGSGGILPYSYNWSNSQAGATSTGLATGTVSVTITDANSCTASTTLEIDTTMVINSSGYTFFQYGTDLIIDTVPSVTPGIAGSNVTYDLTALNTHLFSTNIFMSPTAGVLGSSYPQSNVAVNQDTLFHYFNNSSSQVEYWGTAGNILSNSANNAQVYSNPATVLTFPLTFNTAFTDTSFHDNTYAYNALYQGIWVDSLREKETIITTSVIDGWGTINTPNETFSGLRQNVMKHHIDSTRAKIFVGGFHYWIEVYNDTFNVQTYNYISDASGNNIVTLEYYADSNAIVEAKWNPMTLPVVTAVPTNVSCNGLNDGSATASITGGKTPYSYSWNTTPAQMGATATGLVAGTYTVVVMDSINNTDSISVIITEPATALTATVSSNDAACGVSDGDATVTPAGGTSAYTYLWSDNQTTATATALGAGSYMVTVTDANGCIDSAQANISNAGAATINQDSLTHVACNGGTNGIAYMSATGGTGTLTYAWDISPAQNDSTATGLSAGTYTISVTDASSCIAVQSAIITEPESLVAGILSQTNVSCFGDSNGVATVSVVGGTTSYSYSWNTTPAQITSSATGLKAGSFTVTILDNNSCATTANVTISEPVALTASISSQTDVTCDGNADGTATATGNNGTTPYSYAWSTAPAQNSAMATDLDAGTYTVTVTDANSCTNTNTVTITEPPVLTASISASTNVSCNGGTNGSATVIAGGGTTGYSYFWSNSQATATATGLSLGLYNVTITDGNGCTETATATISEPSALNAAISNQTNVSCNGDSNGVATVTPFGGTSGYTYSWSTLPAQITASATGLKQGTFSVTVTDALGCNKTVTASITQPAVLSATISTQTNVSCNGGNNGSATVAVAGGTSGYSYSWATSPVQNAATATGLTQGSYTVSVSDSKGCTSTTTATITEPIALTANISAQTNLLCNGVPQGSATVTPAGGTSAYTYKWSTSPFQLNATATGLAAGNFTVTVTDAMGCTVTSSALITQPAVLNASISSQTNLVCNGDSSGSATVTANGGTTGYSYSWNTTPSQTTSTATGLTEGSFQVMITDNNGCTKTTTATITAPTVVTAAITSQTDLLCNGDSDGVAVVVATGGTPAYTYVWNTTPVQNSDTATGLPAGIINGTATDANGCSYTFSATISGPVAIAVTTTVTDIACNGDNTGIADATVTGGTSPYSFLWSDVDGQTGNTATGLGADIYTVSITDSNSCSTTAIATVTEPTALLASKTVTYVLCNGDSSGSASVTISGGTSPYSYLWSDGQILNSASGLYAGTFSVLITDSNLCTLNDTVILTEPALLTATAIMVNDVSCFGGNDGSASASAIGGTSPYTYLWSNGSPNPSAGQLIAGDIIVTVTDTNSCSISDTVTIGQPAAALVASTTSTSDVDSTGIGTATINAIGGTSPYTYAWQNGQDSITATGLIAGTYIVTVTDANGCTDTSIATVDFEVSIGSINSLNFTFVAFPNPSKGEFNLEIVSQVNEEVQVTINDVNGRLVYNQKINLVSGKNIQHVSLEKGSDGIYVIQLISKNGVIHIPVTLMK